MQKIEQKIENKGGELVLVVGNDEHGCVSSSGDARDAAPSAKHWNLCAVADDLDSAR